MTDKRLDPEAIKAARLDTSPFGIRTAWLALDIVRAIVELRDPDVWACSTISDAAVRCPSGAYLRQIWLAARALVGGENAT